MRVRKRSSLNKKATLLYGNAYEIKYHAKLIGNVVEATSKTLQDYEASGELDKATLNKDIQELLRFKQVIDSNFKELITNLKAVK